MQTQKKIRQSLMHSINCCEHTIFN